MSIQGTLSTLAVNLTLTDYKLISGLLSYNIGECLDDISPQPEIIIVNSESDVSQLLTFLFIVNYKYFVVSVYFLSVMFIFLGGCGVDMHVT